MRPLTEDESKAVFEKLANYIGKNLVHLVDRQDEAHCFRLHKGRVFYVSEASMRLGISVAQSNLVSLGNCLGKFSKSGKFKLHITSLDYLAQYAKYKVWIKPNGEMPFLYGNHVLKAHLGRITEDTPEHQGVVVYSMNDVPLGFGVTSRSTVDTRKLDPTAIIVFHQADVGEYLRGEVTFTPLLNLPKLAINLLSGYVILIGDTVTARSLSDMSDRRDSEQVYSGIDYVIMSAFRNDDGTTGAASLPPLERRLCCVLYSSMTSNEQDLCQKWLDIPNDQLNASAINEILGAITDDLWVIAAVADRIIDDPDSLYDLLGIALKRSEDTTERLRNSFVLQDSQESSSSSGGHESSSIHVDDDMVSYFRENPSDAQICQLRSILLERKDRVDTFVEMSAANVAIHGVSETPGEWEDDPWVDAADDAEADQPPPSRGPPLSLSTFLSQSLVDSACLLAAREAFGPLQILFKRHGASIWPHRLTVLECIPTHVAPLDYRELLPKLDPSRDEEHQPHFETWRPTLDWTEDPSAQAALSTSGYDAPQNTLSTPSANEEPQPMSSQELTSWYQQRIRAILDSTGMVDVALSLAEHATSLGIPGLDELGEELSLLSRLVYDVQASAEDGPDDDWTLEEWKSMDPLAVVRAMLALSTPESIVADIRKFVMPYLFVLESRAERAGDPNSLISRQLLNDYVLGAPLEMVARIFEESKPTLSSSSRLISDNEDMARLALACLYGSNSLDEWHIMSQIFECLPAWNETSDSEDSEDAVEMTITSLGTYVTPTTARPKCTPSDLFVFFRPLPLPSLSRTLDILDVHLESGEILSRWDAPAPLRWFLQSSNDKSSQRARAVRIARRPGVNRASHSQDDWEWLLEDMLKLCRTNDNGIQSAFGLLSQKEILSIFLSGLLSTGQLEIAKKLLRSKRSALSLDDQAVEEICLTSSREFYDNATSGNYTFGDMKLAYDCLSIPSRSETVIHEQEFIEATSRITSFNVETRPGVPLSPIEIRLTKDRLSLVSRVLSSNNDAYKYKEVILELVDKLGFRGAPVPRVKALAMITDTTLQAEDFAQAFETSETMIDTVSQLCTSPDISISQAELDDAKEVCWVSCFQLGRQAEFPDAKKKLRLLGHALEFCPPDRLHEILAAWRRLEKEDIADQRLESEGGIGLGLDPARRQHGFVAATAVHHRQTRTRHPGGSPAPPSLASRLQNIHFPTSNLVMADGAAIADTFSRVASSFPFSSRGRPQAHPVQPEGDTSHNYPHGEEAGWPSLGREEVSAQASRALQRGIGWLIGADE